MLFPGFRKLLLLNLLNLLALNQWRLKLHNKARGWTQRCRRFRLRVKS